MAKIPLWQTIAQALTADISGGHYRPGDRLPTEAELSTRFGVNRHTVRQALAEMATAGTVRSRRGAGVFVTARPADYPLGRRVRFHKSISALGRTAGRRLTRLETRPCDTREAEALGLTPGAAVHVVEGVSLVDGQPLAFFRSIFDARTLPDFLDHIQEQQSITAALNACGVADYTRAWTRMTAKLAHATLALALEINDGAPILRTESVNVDTSGRPVEYGRTWFAGDRVTLTMTPED